MAFSFVSPSPQQQQQQSLFQPQQQQQFQFQQQQLQQQQQQQQQMFLFTTDKSPANYSTKWADLHPDSQKFLLQIEERILEYRDESQRLDQCSRLYDSSVSNDGLELDASHIVQELGGNSTAVEREKILLQELMTVVKDMLRDTEVAVRSFMMLRPRFLHPNVASASNTTASSQISGTAIVPGTTTQPMSSSIVPVFEFYSGLQRRPSPFLQNTVTRFEKYLGECKQWIEELEQLLLSNTDDRSSNSDMSLLHSLPKVMSNVNDYFFHVAAKVEGLHQYIESMKTAYLADQRRRGDGNDPFLEADRRETAKQEAAARRVHPTLHLLSISQPSTQVAGLFASSAMPGASSAPQPSAGPSAASSASSFSFFTATSSAPSASTSSSFLFSTPSASAPTSTLFGPSFSTQASPLGSSTPLFGSTPTPSLFGSSTPSFASTPATTTPSFFGASTPSFSTPTIGSAPLFSSPFASGAAVGSGASFGAATKSSKPKSRSTRRL